ncbi:MAG: prolyl oligopeptidase family serine peptidase [Fimbriimonadaceae bacterium]|nr:prolyl oligopeptidase family serine peptidase [Fimbriimonadaceae bacterium]
MSTPRLLLLGLLLTCPACRGQGDDPPPPPATTRPNWGVIAENLTGELAAARRRTDLDPAARDSNLPLAALEIERLQLRAAAAGAVADPALEADQAAGRDRAEAALRRCLAGEPAHRGETGAGDQGYFERAYFCRTDGSPQPYYLRLPADYDQAKPLPVVIFLHGYVAETSKINPWVLPATQWDLAAQRGFLLCLPHGRRNSDFLGIGEVDVLRVIEELQRWYPVDPDRIVLTGCSMGGYGGWAIGLRHPDRFAALGLMSGQTDFFTWEKRDRDETAFKSWCILQNNPLDLAPNAQHLPMYVQHGALDSLVPVVHSQLIAPVMKELGYDLRYDELAKEEHFIYWQDATFERLFDFCVGKRRPTAPAKLRWRTFTPKQGRCWWVDVRRLQRWGPPADITAEVAGGAVTVSSSNVAELWLDLPAALAPQALELRLNGQAVGPVAAGPHRVLLSATGAATVSKGEPPAARPRVGPAREVFNDAFLVVHATGGDEARARYNKAVANRLQQIWWGFAEGICTVLPDSSLTPDLLANHNLVICGEPQTVRLPGVPDAGRVLPAGVTLRAGQYTVAGKTFEGDNLGMVLLTPHPVTPQRLVLWLSGQVYGQGLPINHQFDLLPDLLVYNDEPGLDGANQYLVGGFLSPDWQLDPAALDWKKP